MTAFKFSFCDDGRSSVFFLLGLTLDFGVDMFPVFVILGDFDKKRNKLQVDETKTHTAFHNFLDTIVRNKSQMQKEKNCTKNKQIKSRPPHNQISFLFMMRREFDFLSIEC